MVDVIERLERRALATLASLASAAILAGTAPARAHSTGEIGHSGKQGSTCNACHSGGTAPAVRFLGPATVGAGETAAYRFEVQSMRDSQRAAGFNVAASGGVLGATADEGERLVDGELTHTMPKANADMVAGWDFTWTAPSEPGAFTLFGAGNSVNRNGQNTGDRASTATFQIAVAAAVTPTPTPTATPLPPSATPPPTRTAVPSAGRTPSAGPGVCVGDCDGSHAVGVNELVAGVGVALGLRPVDACPPDDVNGDAQVGISELVAAVTNALNGCP